MDYLMKLVTTALEWSYQAGETNVRAETLEKAATLLMLRRDTLRIIDGAGPAVEDASLGDVAPGQASETGGAQETEQANVQDPPMQTNEMMEEQAQTGKTPKCPFSGVVSIDLKRFLDSGIKLIECPNCARTRSLEPHKGVIRFPSHEKRKTRTPNNEPRWVMKETTWSTVGE